MEFAIAILSFIAGAAFGYSESYTERKSDERYFMRIITNLTSQQPQGKTSPKGMGETE